MQTNAVVSAFPTAPTEVANLPPGVPADPQNCADSPPDFEQLMRQSAGLPKPPSAPSSNAGAPASGRNAVAGRTNVPAEISTDDSKASSTTAESIDATVGASLADGTNPVGTRSNVPVQSGKVPVPGRGVHSPGKGKPGWSDPTQRVCEAGLAAVVAFVPEAVTPPRPSLGETEGQGTESQPANAGGSPLALNLNASTESVVISEAVPNFVGSENAAQPAIADPGSTSALARTGPAQSTSRTGLEESLRPLVPRPVPASPDSSAATSDGLPLPAQTGNTGDPLMPVLVPDTRSVATSSPSEKPVEPTKNIVAPVNESEPQRHVAAAATAPANGGSDAHAVEVQSPHSRSIEGTSLRGMDFSRFQNLAEDPAANVSPAMLKRARMQPFAGTAVAKDDSSMDKRLQPNQFAGSPEQKLPADGHDVPARATTLTADGAGDRSPAGLQSQRDSVGGTVALVDGTARTITAGNASATVAAANPTRTAEQLLQNLNREVTQFKHYNAESMAVVLKPDANTEIFLHMVTRNGQIEIQARFDRGDYSALNGQWSQLQQSLSQQGVRLGGLQEGFQNPQHQASMGGSGWGHNQMNQQGRQQSNGGGEEARREAFDDYLSGTPTKNSAKKPAVARSAAPRSSLEAWA